MDESGVVGVQAQLSLADMCHNAAAEFGKSKEQPKPSDECYTPPEVYRVVLDYCIEHYNIDPEQVIRPFKPGGDYTREDYAGKVVIDNPPFSILAQIKRFYVSEGVPFFLFAPTLMLFSPTALVSSCCHICCGYSIRYANGVQVATSFVTNMEHEHIVKTEPQLYAAIKAAQGETGKRAARVLGYPDQIVTAARLKELAKNGVELNIRQSECCPIPALDEQRTMNIKKGCNKIFGGGLLLSTKATERWQAAKEEKRRNQDTRRDKDGDVLEFHLTEREKAIVKMLDARETA